MMRLQKIYLSIFTLTFVLAVVPQIVMAQGAPPATPIDGGLSLLLAGGVAYGVSKIKRRNKS